MSGAQEKEEGQEKIRQGKAEEKIGRDTHDMDRELEGNAEKEYGKAEEKVGRKREDKGM